VWRFLAYFLELNANSSQRQILMLLRAASFELLFLDLSADIKWCVRVCCLWAWKRRPDCYEINGTTLCSKV
jgi:hypothetical protein